MGGKHSINPDALRDLAAQGKTVIQAADILGKSVSGVRYAAARAGVKLSVLPKCSITRVQIQACLDDGLNGTEAGKRLGVAASTIKAKAKGFGIKFPRNYVKFTVTKKELRALIEEGLSQTLMGVRLGVTAPTIGKRLCKFGLKCDGRTARRGAALPRALAERLCAEGLAPVAIADRVGLSCVHVRALLREYKLIDPADRRIPAVKIGTAPRIPEDDLRSLSGLHTTGERMFTQIGNQESMVIGRGYLEISRGLDKAGDVIIRAKTKCGVAVSFSIGARVPKVCSRGCRCGGRYGEKAET